LFIVVTRPSDGATVSFAQQEMADVIFIFKHLFSEIFYHLH